MLTRSPAAIGSDGRIYSADSNHIAGYADLADLAHFADFADLPPLGVHGPEHDFTGSVIFQVPNGIKVLKIQWRPSAAIQSSGICGVSLSASPRVRADSPPPAPEPQPTCGVAGQISADASDAWPADIQDASAGHVCAPSPSIHRA
jgi:hypothetical protein